MPDFRIRETCRACDSTRLQRVIELPDQPLANELPAAPIPGGQDLFPLYIAQCQDCEHVQCPVVVDPKRLFGEYRYVSGTSSTFREHLDKQADSLTKSLGPGRAVEIGSNDGTLIAALRGRGWKAIGVDPAAALAFGATEAGNVTIPGFFTGNLADQLLALFGGPVDLVVANNVFAHADDLLGIAQGAAKLIRGRGTFCFEVANLHSVLKLNEIGSLYHEHLSHWSARPLRALLARAGMTLSALENIPSQGGSIRGFAHASEIGEHQRPTAARPLIDCSGWQGRVESDCEKLRAMLFPWVGKGLAVYGCPARLTPWVYAIGLRPGDVACVFDDNPHKVGRFTPGLFWPIVSSSELMERNPPAILIASWNYADEIKAKFPGYRGEWLVMR